MSDTRLIAPVLPHRARPVWLAPLCTLIVASPFALAAGMATAWMTNPDPTTVSVAQPEPAWTPPPSAEPATAAPSSSSSRHTAEPSSVPPRTVTRWRAPLVVLAPPATPATTPSPVASSAGASTTSETSTSTSLDDSSAGVTQTPGSTP